MTITALLIMAAQIAMPKMMTITVVEVRNPGDFKVRDTYTNLVMDFKTCNDKTDFKVDHRYSVAFNETREGCKQIVGMKETPVMLY